MKNKKLVLLIVLSALAILSLVYGILTPSKVKREISRSGQPAVQAPAIPAAAKPLAFLKRAERKKSGSDFGRHPFVRLILDGIVWDAKSPQAVINGQIVSVGDEVAGQKVIKIGLNSVVLSDGIKEQELRLKAENG